MRQSNQKPWPGLLALFGVIGGLTVVTPDTVVPSAHAQSDPLVFVPVDAPCRVVRTRGTGQTHLIAGAPRNFFSFGSAGTIGAQGGEPAFVPRCFAFRSASRGDRAEKLMIRSSQTRRFPVSPSTSTRY